MNFDESKDATAIIAANALRAHDDVAVSRDADVFDGLFVNGIHVCDKHDGSLPVNENEIAFADERLSLEFFAEAFEKLLLSGAKEIFQSIHAGTSSALQLWQSSPSIESLWKNFSHSAH